MTPRLFNFYKPKGMGSQDVVRHFKRNHPLSKQEVGKIGHFGTLDPFAHGVLIIAIAGAARLNDFVHEFLPKTYLASGQLGIATATGDLTSKVVKEDHNPQLIKHLQKLSVQEIQSILQQKYVGEYWQSPHHFSAAKYKGRPLHEWARKGVTIDKGPKKREIYELEVLSFCYPQLTIRFRVSSGTYIRTLFEDCARELGTIGVLSDLLRESVGNIHHSTAIKPEHWPSKGQPWPLENYALNPKQVLPFSEVVLNEVDEKKFRHGNDVEFSSMSKSIVEKSQLHNEFFWVNGTNHNLMALGVKKKSLLRPQINFAAQ